MQLRSGLGLLCTLCVLFMLAPAAAGGSTSVSIYPPTTIVELGDTFTVFVWSDDDSVEFNGYEAVLNFDSAALGFVGAEEESVMTSNCHNRFWRTYPGPDSIFIGHGLLCPDTTVTGPGALSSLTFEALSEGRTIISADFFWFTRAGLYFKNVIWHDGVVIVGTGAGIGGEVEGAWNSVDIKPNPGRAFDIGVQATSPAYRDSRASLKVYDITGRQVRDLWDGLAVGGGLRVHWDGNDGRGQPVPPGIYFLAFSADSYERTRKLVVVR